MIALGATTLIAGACAIVTAWAIDTTLSAFRDTHAMVALITQDGLKFDDKETEKQLSGATAALRFCYEVALALGVSTAMIALALVVRVWREMTSPPPAEAKSRSAPR